MTDEIKTDATKALDDVKAAVAGVDADAAKVKVFWTDYRLYIACTLCLVLGAIVGHAI
jgi:hypothetical protein